MTKISLRDIYFTQDNVSSNYSLYNGISKPVAAWEDNKPYTIPIDVVKTSDGKISSLDNRRLYSAKFSDRDMIECNILHWNANLKDKEKEIFRFPITIRWDGKHKGEPGVFILSLGAAFYEHAVAFRCATQNTNFDLFGSKELPTLRHLMKGKRNNGQVCKRNGNRLDLSHDWTEILTIIESCSSDSRVLVTLEEVLTGPGIEKKDILSYLLTCTEIPPIVDNFQFCSNWFIRGAGDVDDIDGYDDEHECQEYEWRVQDTLNEEWHSARNDSLLPEDVSYF